MPALAKPRHEHFAQQVAKGVSPTKAYISAGYSENGAAASGDRLRKNALVCARVDELKPVITAIAIKSTGMDKAWVLRQLRISLFRARKAGQHTASIRAAELIGKEQSMFVDRKDVTMRRSLTDLSDEEINALIADAERRETIQASSGSIQ